MPAESDATDQRDLQLELHARTPAVVHVDERRAVLARVRRPVHREGDVHFPLSGSRRSGVVRDERGPALRAGGPGRDEECGGEQSGRDPSAPHPRNSSRPSPPAAATTSGSGIFVFQTVRSAATAMSAVGTSRIAPARDDDGGARECARGGRGDAEDERGDRGPRGESAHVRGRQDHEDPDRQEHAECRGRRPRDAADEVADERDRDDDRARRDHRDGDGVEELPLVQPAEVLHDAAVEERDDRESAAEDEGPGLREEKEDFEKELGVCRAVQSGQEGCGRPRAAAGSELRDAGRP